jgi:processive 1,2-diacylglycerol beta-glucosyltransferase
MRARAVAAWARRAPELGLEVRIQRPLEASHGLYRFGVGLYNWIQRTAPALHHLYFNWLELFPLTRRGRPLGARRFAAVLEQLRPDVLLSVHDSLNHAFFRLAREVLPNVRCVTYCGELHGGYGFSRHWVNPAAELFIGAVPETCEAAVRLGMPRERTMVGGFLLRPAFYEAAGAPASDPKEFLLLLCASSRGANNHIGFLEALRRQRLQIPVAVLCGKSAAARQRVETWAERNPELRVRVFGHNADVAALMRAASAVVARPGTGTTSEAIVSGCPLLLNCIGGTMPQERITIRFCRNHGLAQTLERAQQLPGLLRAWIERPELAGQIRERMRAVRPAGDPLGILRALTAGTTGAGAAPAVQPMRNAQQTDRVWPEKIRPR